VSALDELAPEYAEDARIKLTLADPLSPIRARQPLTVLVDVSGCEPQGVQLPMELLIVGPNGARTFEHHTDRRLVRPSITFTPRSSGRYAVTYREAAHNRWWGRLDVDVVGDLGDDREP
jgi:hypothetical protein